MKPMIAKLGLPFVAALGLGAAPAQAQSGEIVFVDLGRWTIYEMTSAGYCEIRLKSGVNGSLALRRQAGSPASLRVALGNARSFGGDVVFAFDDVQFSGQVINGNTFAPAYDSAELEAEFRKAETLSIIQGGATVASISLKSSAAAHRLVIQCADQWRSGFFPPRNDRVASLPPQRTPPPSRQPVTPPPSPSVTAPRTGPYPANRAVAPRNASQWIQPDDFRRLPEIRGDGILTFSLLVNPKGEVEECSVLKSSGSRQLDGQTCRLLQKRARFDPATDANGFAIKATYSSQVEFNAAR